MNKFKRDQYLVDRVWSKKMAQMEKAIREFRYYYSQRNENDELIDNHEVARGALRDVRVAILDIVTCDIRWDNYGLKSPYLIARELTDIKGFGG